MTPRRETLVLTLAADPALAHLARRVALHFFLQNGIDRAKSRKQSRIVERRCEALLRSRPPKRGQSPSVPGAGAPLTLTLVSGARMLEVFGRRSGGPVRGLMLGIERPEPRRSHP